MPSTEQLEVEVIRSGRGPEAERINGLATVANHRPVKRDAEENRRPADDGTQHALSKFERTVQFYFDRFLQPCDFPGVRTPQPVIRLLTLPAILDGLLEDAVLVAQTIAHAGNLHRRHRINEAGRQPAEAAVAQPSIRFHLG